MLAGGATVPGRDLIDTLPLVWQTVWKSELWQLGRASAAGIAMPVTTTRPASTSADVLRCVMSLFTFGVEVGALITGNPR